MTTIPVNGTVYIRQIGGSTGNIRYSYDLVSGGTTILFPATILNTDTSVRAKVLFIGDITINNLNQYFICGSENIQFGSESLNTDGTRYTITVSVNNYPGFIQNGRAAIPIGSFTNIYIYNLFIDGSGYQTDDNGGWVGQAMFGAEKVCYITNCASSGDIGTLGGGIVGAGAGGQIGGSLTIRGCSSTGNMGQWAGGIAGSDAGGSYGSVVCESCWSEGNIGQDAGGILGSYAGNNGSATVTKCYSLGDIGQQGGGIFGYYAAEVGEATAEKCYSRGPIGLDAGGIFGRYAAYVSPPGTGGTTNAINCYSSGNIATSGNGIYGSTKGGSTFTTNCYSANGSWSSISANLSLQGLPTPVLGTTWVVSETNQPYELNGMGYTPYTTDIINTSTSELIQTFSESIEVGQSSSVALTSDASGNSFEILSSTGDGTITMSAQTGRISTTSATSAGTYTIILRSVGSYNITEFTLTVLLGSGSSEAENAACCTKETFRRGPLPDNTTRTELVRGNMLLGGGTRRGVISYSDMIAMKKAVASKI